MAGKGRPGVSVIIPVLNEEENLRELLPEIREIMDGMGEEYEIIVVDGGSSDRSMEVAREHGATVLSENVGKGNALITGFGKARGDIIVMMDADLSHRPKELLLMVDAIRIGYDAAFGSRFMVGGGTEDMEWYRKLGNRVFAAMVNIIFGSRYTDLCYGYKSFSRHALERLELGEKGFGIETEMAIEAARKGLRVIEIPSFEKKRWKGKGKLSTFRDGFKILATIIRKVFG